MRASEPLERIATVSRELVDSMSDIVWAINPQRDRGIDLVHRMRRFATDVFTARDIDFQFRTEGVFEDMRLAADTRRHFYLIFKEAVHNVIRHVNCNSTWIHVAVVSGWLILKIRDNGAGIMPASDHDGHGLASMRARAVILNGKLEIPQEHQGGTCMVLRVPIQGYMNRWSLRRLFGVSS
jgi:signal transduction histidine kinase